MKNFLPAVMTGCSQNRSPMASLAAPTSLAALPAPVPEKLGALAPAQTVPIRRETMVPDGQTNADGITLPKGFSINVFAQDLNVPRRLAIAPGASPTKYDVFVSESKSDRIRVLRESDGDGKADEKFIFTDKADQPYGLAFWKDWLYVGNTDSIVRFPYKSGATEAGGAAEPVANLTRGGYNQHWTRNLLFSPDGKQLFVTVGSSCNTCEENDSQRAAISILDPDGTHKRVFASGLRNPVGLAWHPGSGELWTAVNERDNLGDDVPPDYITSVKKDAFYGWPYAYTDIDGKIHPDPTFGDKQPDLVQKTTSPDVPVQAHSAALGIAFYPLKGGQFPKEYQGDAFVSFHGSWNRSEKTGYKVVRVHFEGGKAVSVTDFVRGIRGGRPVDVQIAPDGSLLFSDDGRGIVWRVSYQK